MLTFGRYQVSPWIGSPADLFMASYLGELYDIIFDYATYCHHLLLMMIM